jgi:hypothetical protein
VAYDVGDATPVLQITVKDSSGTLATGGTVVCTITAPDGTTSTPSVTNASTGIYQATPVTTTAGRYGVRWTVTAPSANATTDVYDVLDAALLPIVSLSDLKAHLKDSTTTGANDEQYRYVLAQATEIAERYCNRALRRKTVVETADGDREAIVLREPPVISITTVVENGVTLSASDYTLNASAGLLFRGGSTSSQEWYDGRQSVTVTYVAGYANPPLVAQRTVLDIAKWLWQRAQNGPRPGFGQSADADTFGTDALPTWLMRPLDSLVMPGIA